MMFGMSIIKIQMAKCKDIVWAFFPFTDQQNAKRRPVLILSINSHNDYICLPITSTNVTNSIKLISGNLSKPVTDLKLLSLITTSYLSLEQIMTITEDSLDLSASVLTTINEKTFTDIKSKITAFNC